MHSSMPGPGSSTGCAVAALTSSPKRCISMTLSCMSSRRPAPPTATLILKSRRKNSPSACRKSMEMAGRGITISVVRAVRLKTHNCACPGPWPSCAATGSPAGSPASECSPFPEGPRLPPQAAPMSWAQRRARAVTQAARHDRWRGRCLPLRCCGPCRPSGEAAGPARPWPLSARGSGPISWTRFPHGACRGAAGAGAAAPGSFTRAAMRSFTPPPVCQAPRRAACGASDGVRGA